MDNADDVVISALSCLPVLAQMSNSRENEANYPFPVIGNAPSINGAGEEAEVVGGKTRSIARVGQGNTCLCVR